MRQPDRSGRVSRYWRVDCQRDQDFVTQKCGVVRVAVLCRADQLLKPRDSVSCDFARDISLWLIRHTRNDSFVGQLSQSTQKGQVLFAEAVCQGQSRRFVRRQFRRARAWIVQAELLIDLLQGGVGSPGSLEDVDFSTSRDLSKCR